MPELGFLTSTRAAREAGEQSLHDAYAHYLADQRSTNPAGVPMSAEEFRRYSLGSDWLSDVRDMAKKVVQTCRLMVGIHDYEYYLAHMRERHPDAVPLTRDAFYRYCLEARYPSDTRRGSGRCPC
ncbi:YbdD/YjiX family protein [Uliginosibacterium sp. H1]|uniref:YbdD/YjiX family protein n=1 Tax=Uliginosibacterium sp. H1 TaxID=3114757 RepID=UPI002E19835D|nr:CstA-like transporter-associated (seleno)protein [Uliginosibacterium sp. H1]